MDKINSYIKMAKRKKQKLTTTGKLTRNLVISAIAGTLIGFGTLNWFTELGWPSWISIVFGILILFIALFLGWFTTETAVAMKKR